MSEKRDRARVLTDLGDEILTAMATVSEAAGGALWSPQQGASLTALAAPSNMMVGEAKPERFLIARYAEERADLARLLLDPFVARVEVEWLPDGPSQTTYYFARRSAAGLTKVIKNAAFVASGTKLGALAEYEAGEVATIEISGMERKGRVLKRAVLSPQMREGRWDALLASFEIEACG